MDKAWIGIAEGTCIEAKGTKAWWGEKYTAKKGLDVKYENKMENNEGGK